MKYVSKSLCRKLKEICANKEFRGIGVDEELDKLAATLNKSNRPADILDDLLPLKGTLENISQDDKAQVISDILDTLL